MVAELDIDAGTSPDGVALLTDVAAGHPRLSVDLSAAAYLDSAGIAILFDVARHTQLELILGPRSLIARVIEISQLDQVATISVRQ